MRIVALVHSFFFLFLVVRGLNQVTLEGFGLWTRLTVLVVRSTTGWWRWWAGGEEKLPSFRRMSRKGETKKKK